MKMPTHINAAKYLLSRHIRLAQPSGGKPYGIRLPSKRGAEMVLAYLDGNPDRLPGLGFVPRARPTGAVF